MNDVEILAEHVGRFNEGVRSGDFERMLELFSEDAVLEFEACRSGRFTAGTRFARRTAIAHRTTRSTSAIHARSRASPWLRTSGEQTEVGRPESCG